jgi:hypothetical protein
MPRAIVSRNDHKAMYITDREALLYKTERKNVRKRIMPWKDKSKYKTDRYKQYRNDYNRNWYTRHKREVVARNTKRKLKMREIYQQVREGLLCADCGETHPATLHFHHRNPQEKEFSIADFVRKGKSPEALLKEIGKCIVLCANCHAKRHYNLTK